MTPKSRAVLQELGYRIKGNMIRHAGDLGHLLRRIGRHKNVLGTTEPSRAQAQFMQRRSRGPVDGILHEVKDRKHRKSLESQDKLNRNLAL